MINEDESVGTYLPVFSNIKATDSIFGDWHIIYATIPNNDTLCYILDKDFYHDTDTLLWGCVDFHISAWYKDMLVVDTILNRRNFASLVPSSFLKESDLYNFIIKETTIDSTLLCGLSLLQAETDYDYVFEVNISSSTELTITLDTTFSEMFDE